jgi:hypothetical protein
MQHTKDLYIMLLVKVTSNVNIIFQPGVCFHTHRLIAKHTPRKKFQRGYKLYLSLFISYHIDLINFV